MSNVDAVRLLASEYNLEFVDLERYSVDSSAAVVLPGPLARKHNVVPIGRKFGAPVIAIADPGDVMAMDSIRAAIGREFISVVASAEQIVAALVHIYGGEPAHVPATPASGVEADTAGPRMAPTSAVGQVSEDPLSAALGDALSLSVYGSAFAPQTPATSTDDAGVGDSGDPAWGLPGAPSVEVADQSDGSLDLNSQAWSADHQGDDLDQSAIDAASRAHARLQSDFDLPEAVRSFIEQVPDSEGARLHLGDGADSADPFQRLAALGDDHAVIDPSFFPPGWVVGHNAETAPGGFGSAEVSPMTDVGVDIDPVPAASDSRMPEAGKGDLPNPVPTGSDANSFVDLMPTGLSSEADLAFAPPASGASVERVLAEDADEVAQIVDGAVAEFESSVAEAAGGEGRGTEVAEVPLGGDLARGLGDPDNSGFPPLARVLVDGNRVSFQDMQEVIDEHDRTGQTLARLLTARGLVSEADLMWGMASEMGLEFVDLEARAFDSSSAYVLSEATARHHNVIVIGRDDNNRAIVATANPTDVFAMDDLRTILGRSFVTVVATRSQIVSSIDRTYSQGGDASSAASTAASDFEDVVGDDLENLRAVVDDAPIVRYVNLLILQALNERASDIHVEPTADNLRIRYRIDGVLHDMSTAPRSISAAVTTRLKVMAEMNIAEHRIPQDGRISLNVGNRGLDLRMATLPTIYGEKIVMRVLDKSNVLLGFEDLGFDADLLEVYRKIYSKPYGTILVTGPTGSGKTTTLYATLAALNSPEKNIITVEDPVELRIKGINQVQLNAKAGLTFASALKSILRSDPDIVLVGEIRDQETALISIEAALTGHLVLATLHTNDAASTPMRLVEMGIEPFLVTSAASAVLAQRLARRLCVHCKEPFDPSEAEIIAAGWNPADVFADGNTIKLHRSVGCSACSNTGYRGRKALLELLEVTDEVERLIIEGGSVEAIHHLAVDQGMVPLRQSGLRKALEGETTLEEVLRVVA